MTRLIDADALVEVVKQIDNCTLMNTSCMDAITNAPTVQRELVIDCNTCANKGVVNGLSQETFCEHCIHLTSWKRNHYQPHQQIRRNEDESNY